MDVEDPACGERDSDDSVDLDVVTVVLQSAHDVGGRPGVRKRRGRAPANARAAAPSATDASGVMTKLFIARPSFGGPCARLLT